MALGRTVGIIPVPRFRVSRQLFVSFMRISILVKRPCCWFPFLKQQDGLHVLVDGKYMQIHEHRYMCWLMVITYGHMFLYIPFWMDRNDGQIVIGLVHVHALQEFKLRRAAAVCSCRVKHGKNEGRDEIGSNEFWKVHLLGYFVCHMESISVVAWQVKFLSFGDCLLAGGTFILFHRWAKHENGWILVM